MTFVNFVNVLNCNFFYFSNFSSTSLSEAEKVDAILLCTLLLPPLNAASLAYLVIYFIGIHITLDFKHYNLEKWQYCITFCHFCPDCFSKYRFVVTEEITFFNKDITRFWMRFHQKHELTNSQTKTRGSNVDK